MVYDLVTEMGRFHFLNSIILMIPKKECATKVYFIQCSTFNKDYFKIAIITTLHMLSYLYQNVNTQHSLFSESFAIVNFIFYLESRTR